MRNGTITRPASAKEPIIRVVGDAENHITDGEILVVPDIPPDWDEILHGMFSECVEVRGFKQRKRTDGVG